jgi:hypothetical protein
MLTPEQLTILQAVINRIIPPDDDPGGWEAGVGDYLMAQFKRDLKPLLPQYRQALDALEAEALSFVGRSFVRLDTDAQDALLRQVERGNTETRWPVDPAAFFKLLVEHCAEGYYSDPGNGGNRDQVAWQMIGFEVTQ